MPGSEFPDLRALLDSNKTAYCAWLGLGVSLGVEIAGKAGWQAVLLDNQHGIGDQVDMLECLTAARAAGLPAMVRVPGLDYGVIGRALDAGAQGVVVPMIETCEEAVRLVEAVKYPAAGRRSTGAYRAGLVCDGEYFSTANGWTIACAQIETVRGLENVEALCSVSGIDMILVGPNDLAISMSGGKSRDIAAPAVLEAVEQIRACAARHGKMTAIFANDQEYAKKMIAAGWQMVSVGTDISWLRATARQMLPTLAK